MYLYARTDESYHIHSQQRLPIGSHLQSELMTYSTQQYYWQDHRHYTCWDLMAQKGFSAINNIKLEDHVYWACVIFFPLNSSQKLLQRLQFSVVFILRYTIKTNLRQQISQGRCHRIELCIRRCLDGMYICYASYEYNIREEWYSLLYDENILASDHAFYKKK